MARSSATEGSIATRGSRTGLEGRSGMPAAISRGRIQSTIRIMRVGQCARPPVRTVAATGRRRKAMDVTLTRMPATTESGISSRGIRVAVGFAVAASATQLLDFAVIHARWLDMNTHASVFGAISLLALALSGLLAALLARSETSRSRASVLLPVLLAVLLGLRLVHPVHVVFFALPCAAATLVLLWEHDGAHRTHALYLIRIGCLVLAGSYLAHASGVLVSAAGYGRHTWPTEARLLIGHTGELAGWVLVASGLASAYESVRQKK